MIKLWDVATGRETTTLKGHTGKIRSVSFTRDGKSLASAANDKTIKLWDIATGTEQITLRVRGNPPSSVAFTTDGKTLVSASRAGLPSGSRSPDGGMTFWDVATRSKQFTLKGDGSGNSMSITVDGRWAAIGPVPGGGPVTLWDVANRKVQAHMPGHTARVWRTAFSPDGKLLASACWDGTVKLWDVPNGKLRATLKGNVSRFYSVAFTPDGTTLIAGGGTPRHPGQIMLWDIGSRK